MFLFLARFLVSGRHSKGFLKVFGFISTKYQHVSSYGDPKIIIHCLGYPTPSFRYFLDCLAYLLKRNGKSTEIPHWDTGEPTGITVEEYAGLLRKAPTPMLPDVYVKTINHEVEDVVLAKFYEIVPEDLFQNYFKFFS